jgi:ABC-type dipeptide/oligopeptide/nickel transport system permease component
MVPAFASMHTYILRRLLLMFPTLLGITAVVFAAMALSPGGITAESLVAGQNLEPQAKKALEEYYNRRYGLDQPAPLQYLRWLNNVSPVGFVLDAQNRFGNFSLLKGSDLGMSFRYGRRVGDLIAERLPITILLNALSLPLIYIVAVGIGVRSATMRGSAFDVGSSIVMLALWSIPTMLAGVLLLGFFASDQYWQWFPTAGLNRREALDMAFMPHWKDSRDVLRLFFGAFLGAALLFGLSRWPGHRLRMLVMALLGSVLGVSMALQLGESGFSLGLLVATALVGVLFGLVAYTDYLALRATVMTAIGAAVGVGISSNFWEGDFVRGFFLDRLWHFVLPVLCLTYAGFAFLAKLTRSAVLENLMADYARTARAKGVTENQLLWHHVFRNSLLPLITVAATLLPSLLAGSVIVESIFSIDGMGKLAVEAVKGRDRELVLSITLVSGLVTLIGYLIADLLYAVADPRVSYD